MGARAGGRRRGQPRPRNSPFLPGIDLPPEIRASVDLADVLRGAELVLLVPPSQHLRTVSARIAPHLPPGRTVVVATKGIEEGTLTLMSEVLAETLPAVGPDRRRLPLRPELRARGRARPARPTSRSRRTATSRRARCSRCVHSPMFRVYTSDDPIGVQVGGAVKNVIAVAAGACDGLELGTNARAALITRGLAEITRLGVALGANPLTFLGMAGVGDLVLTCTGELSRNRTLGKKLAEGVSPQELPRRAGARVAEGFYTAAAAHELASEGRRATCRSPSRSTTCSTSGRPLLEALPAARRPRAQGRAGGPGSFPRAARAASAVAPSFHLAPAATTPTIPGWPSISTHP